VTPAPLQEQQINNHRAVIGLQKQGLGLGCWPQFTLCSRIQCKTLVHTQLLLPLWPTGESDPAFLLVQFPLLTQIGDLQNTMQLAAEISSGKPVFLSLYSLTTLRPEVARALVAANCPLLLKKLSSVSPELPVEFAAHKSTLELAGDKLPRPAKDQATRQLKFVFVGNKRDGTTFLWLLLMKPCLTVSLTPFQHCSGAVTVTRSCRAISTGLPSRKKTTSHSQRHSEWCDCAFTRYTRATSFHWQ